MDRRSAASLPAHPENSENHTRLGGGALIAARVVYVGVAALALSLFVASVPSRFAELKAVCSQALCTDLQLEPANARALEALGVSVNGYAVLNMAFQVIITLGFCAAAALIAWRKFNDWIGLFASLTLIVIGVFSPGTFDPLAAQNANWLLPIKLLRFLAPAMLTIFLLAFPDGRFIPRWTRWFALGSVVYGLGITFFLDTDALVVNQNWASQITILVLFGQWMAAMGAQIYRYRHVSNGVQRQQTKWVVFGQVVTICALVGFILPAVFLPSLTADGSLYYVIGAPFVNLLTLVAPVSVVFAVLRYRLWDIDILISRTLVYISLSALVIATYSLIVGGLSSVFHTANTLPASLIATGVIAVAFQPMRVRLQQGVNRLMFGKRDDPMLIMDALGKDLEAMLSPEAALSHLVEVTAKTLKLPYVAVERSGGEAAIEFGDRRGVPVRFPLIYQAQNVGSLAAAARAPGETFNTADRLVLENVARHAGNAVYAARLTQDVLDSRQRIVTAREEERRRLRRDLHDGLGPALAALTLKAEAAHDLIASDPEKSKALLADIMTSTQSALTDIRRVVYSLRPPALDDLGLVSAIKEQAAQYASSSLSITLDAPENLPALPAAVEVAAYRIVQEALTNVIRHADAHSCKICLRINGKVEIEVVDDGKGIPDTRRAGVGLNSMHERAAELGGSCVITSQPSKGTQIQVWLPKKLESSGGQP